MSMRERGGSRDGEGGGIGWWSLDSFGMVWRTTSELTTTTTTPHHYKVLGRTLTGTPDGKL